MEICFLPLPSLAPVPKHRTKGRNVITPLETAMIICNVQNLTRHTSHKNNRIVHTGVGEKRRSNKWQQRYRRFACAALYAP